MPALPLSDKYSFWQCTTHTPSHILYQSVVSDQIQHMLFYRHSYFPDIPFHPDVPQLQMKTQTLLPKATVHFLRMSGYPFEGNHSDTIFGSSAHVLHIPLSHTYFWPAVHHPHNLPYRACHPADHRSDSLQLRSVLSLLLPREWYPAHFFWSSQAKVPYLRSSLPYSDPSDISGRIHY